MRRRLSRIMNMANAQNLNVNIIKNNKERADALQTKLNSVKDLINVSIQYLSILENIEVTTKSQYAEYQKSRIGFAEESLKENIDYLFADRGFTPVIDYSFSRNNVKCSLTLKDKEGNVRNPRITEGGFLKQLIGYTSSISILRLLNSKTFFIDEAFSQASSDSKEAMQAIIYNYTVKNGIQTILISQSSECYYQLPRREFRLAFENGHTVLKSVEDFDSDFDPSVLGFGETDDNQISETFDATVSDNNLMNSLPSGVSLDDLEKLLNED